MDNSETEMNTKPTAVFVIFGFVVGGVIGSAITIVLSGAKGLDLSKIQLPEVISNTPIDAQLTYLLSIIVILMISVFASRQIKEILESRRNEPYIKRANYIAMMTGLVLTAMLFKQPYLERLFAGHDAGVILEAILFGGGATIGWLAWYLYNLKHYGEFFHVLLLTSTIGLCWYARLSAPAEIQITATAFLLGSLFHIAKDYMDKGNKHEG